MQTWSKLLGTCLPDFKQIGSVPDKLKQFLFAHLYQILPPSGKQRSVATELEQVEHQILERNTSETLS